jgi:uncharacterized membrane protein
MVTVIPIPLLKTYIIYIVYLISSLVLAMISTYVDFTDGSTLKIEGIEKAPVLPLPFKA